MDLLGHAWRRLYYITIGKFAASHSHSANFMSYESGVGAVPDAAPNALCSRQTGALYPSNTL